MANLVNIATRFRASLQQDGWGKTARKGVSLVRRRLLAWEQVPAWLRPGVLSGYLDYRLNPRALHVQKGTDWPFDPQAVRAQLQQSGVLVEFYRVDVMDFKRWCQAANYPDSYARSISVRTEKLLEHYLFLELLPPITPRSVIIDVACAGSPFAAAMRRLYGCVTCRQDLVYPEGIHRAADGIEEIGGNAAFMPLPDSFASGLVSHCAFEMFIGDNDSLFIREAARVLQPGGRLVIIPLYLSSLHHHLVDPLADRRGVNYDPGARIVYRPSYYRVASARFYSVEAFMRRVVAYRSGLSLKVIFVENEKEVDPSCYLKFVAVFERPAKPKAARGSQKLNVNEICSEEGLHGSR